MVPLFSFDGTNGSLPFCNLVRGANGEFYGTTSTYPGPPFHSGSVFKISADGHFSTVATFGTNFGVPTDGLVLGKDGNFYGTAVAGGGTNNGGAIFKMTPQGKLTEMVEFGGTNGIRPSGLLQGVDGNFYGITQGFGFPNGNVDGYGTVFKMSPGGELTTLFAFDLTTNGASPTSLVQGLDGNLYGTTLDGGTYYGGTVFEVTTNGAFTLLWSCDGTNGAGLSSVMQAADGNLYGAAVGGGPNTNGTIFRLTTNGAVTLLHAFSQLSSLDENADGSIPSAQLMQGRDGAIYGGTRSGGSNLFENGTFGGIGTLFKVTTNGVFTTLCSFGQHTNVYKTAALPNGLIQDKKGNFFGTTFRGGIYDVANFGLGTVFKLVTVRPVLAITGTRQDGPLTNAVTVSGKTKGNVQTVVTNVLYQLNGGDWMQAVTTNNWTNWSASITLSGGSNLFRACAFDANGDASRTNSARLHLQTGLGP